MKFNVQRSLENMELRDIKRLVQLHEEIVLSIIAVFLGAIIILFYVWGIGSLATHIGAAISPPVSQKEAVGFNLDDAGKLNFRGLENN